LCAPSPRGLDPLRRVLTRATRRPQTLAAQQKQMALRLLPKDPADEIGAILLEIRAGAPPSSAANLNPQMALRLPPKDPADGIGAFLLEVRSSATVVRRRRLGVTGSVRIVCAVGAVTRRPPIPLYTMAPRTGSYAYDVGVWESSIV
jgi:hypothetical protein